jgi:hypothetical protein
MARLFIANPTRQEQVICYRLDFNNQGDRMEADRTRFQPAKQQTVPPGRQVQLGGDFHPNQITDIIDQLKPYGLIGEVDVPRMERKVVPYVYQIDRYVGHDTFRKVIAHNSGILIEDGKQRRAKAAVASSEIVQNAVANQFQEAGIEPPPIDQVEIGYEQLEQSEAGESTIAEGFRVDLKTTEPSQPAAGKVQKARGRPRKNK